MVEILLLSFFALRNGMRARMKGVSPFLWALITVGAYFAMMMLGTLIVIVYFCRDVINVNQFAYMDSKSRELAVVQLQQVFNTHPLHVVTVELFGIGGYLFVRYLLDRKPTKKNPELI